MAILVYACLLLIFGISIGYTLYYVYEIDTLPLTMVMFLLVSFSIMVLHIQWKSALYYENFKLRLYRKCSADDHGLDIGNMCVCLNAACDAFLNYRYTCENLDEFTFQFGGWTCVIRLKKNKLYVYMKYYLSKNGMRVVYCDFDKNVDKFRIKNGSLLLWVHKVRTLEVGLVENEHSQFSA